MAISDGFWPLNLSVESLVLREIVPICTHFFLTTSHLQNGVPCSDRVPVSRGATGKKTEKTTYICASSQKKVRTYLLFLCVFFLCAFLGVSRQGGSKTRETFFECVSKKIAGEIFIRGGIFFPGGFFLLLFLSIFVVALVKRLSVRGTQRRDEKVLRGRASNFFPPYRFFYCVFGRFSIRGTQKRDKKNHVIVRVQKFNPGQIKYVRTLVFFSFFFLSPLETERRVGGRQ